MPSRGWYAARNRQCAGELHKEQTVNDVETGMSEPLDMNGRTDFDRRTEFDHRTNAMWLWVAVVAIVVLGLFAWYSSDSSTQRTGGDTAPMATSTDGSTPAHAPAGGRS
jgi:hypothetical protein